MSETAQLRDELASYGRLLSSYSAEVSTLRLQLESRDQDIADFVRALERRAAERDRLREAIQTALDHWPGEAHLGTAYYALHDAIFPSRPENER